MMFFTCTHTTVQTKPMRKRSGLTRTKRKPRGSPTGSKRLPLRLTAASRGTRAGKGLPHAHKGSREGGGTPFEFLRTYIYCPHTAEGKPKEITTC